MSDFNDDITFGELEPKEETIDTVAPKTMKKKVRDIGEIPASFKTSNGIDPSLHEPDADPDAMVLPDYLEELKDKYSKPNLLDNVENLVNEKFDKISTQAFNLYWTQFEDEAKECIQMPFEKDGEFEDGLESVFNLIKEKLELEFEGAKYKVTTQAETAYSRVVANTLAKVNMYPQLKQAYTSYLKENTNIDQMELFELHKTQNNLVNSYKRDKDEFLADAAAQYDREHLTELDTKLESLSDNMLKEALDKMEEELAPGITALTNKVAPLIKTGSIPVLEQMKRRYDELEIQNESQTKKALEDFQRRIRREKRQQEQGTYQIHVEDSLKPTVNGTLNLDDTKVNEAAPLFEEIETPVAALEQDTDALNANLDSILNGDFGSFEISSEPETVTEAFDVEEPAEVDLSEDIVIPEIEEVTDVQEVSEPDEDLDFNFDFDLTAPVEDVSEPEVEKVAEPVTETESTDNELEDFNFDDFLTDSNEIEPEAETDTERTPEPATATDDSLDDDDFDALFEGLDDDENEEPSKTIENPIEDIFEKGF